MQSLQLPKFARSGGGLLILGIGLMTSASGSQGATLTPITNTNQAIGLLLPPEQAESSSIRDGVTLAVEHANTTAAAPVRIVIRGRVGQWGADAVEAARMVTDDGVAGLIAPPNGAATHLVLQVAGRTAVPVVSLCADESVTRTGVPWMVRVVPGTIPEARALLKGLQGDAQGQPKHCVALLPDERSGRVLAGDLKKAYAGTGCVLQNIIQFKSSPQGQASVTKQVLESGPDVVLLWLDPVPAGAVAKTLRAAGFKGKLAGPGRLRSAEFAAAAGNALEGFVFTELARDSESETRFQGFRTAFRERFGHEPAAMSAFSYDAASLLIHLVATNTPAASRLFPIRSCWPGVSGTLRFDAEGNRIGEFRLVIAHQGREQKSLTEGH